MTSTYPKLAFCSAITPTTEEHYDHLIKAGIYTVSVCLHVSGFNHYKFAHLHTNLARKKGMITHAHLVTDLYDPIADVTKFTQRLVKLGYTSTSKITILVNSDKYVKDRETKIIKMIDLLSNYHNRECIDLAFFKRDLDDGLYKLDLLPKLINLTIINVGGANSSFKEAGTWIYTMEMDKPIQILAYDYYGFYTSGDYQLSLIDNDYVVQPGDTWYSISRRHGIPVGDLLVMNRAVAEDRIFSGQVIRIA